MRGHLLLPPVLMIDSQANFANTYLGGILIFVAFLNAFIDWYQTQKSEAILASFLAMIPLSCRVIRDGTLVTIPAADLVVGDVVLVACQLLVHVSYSFLPSVPAYWRQNSGRSGPVCCFGSQG